MKAKTRMSTQRSIILRGLVVTLVTFLMAGCSKDKTGIAVNSQISVAYSILVDNGSVFISGISNTNNQITSKYWIDSQHADSSIFVSRIKNGSLYKQAVDDKYRVVYGYKTPSGENQVYKFDQGSLVENGRIFYYKNNSLIYPDTTALGTLSSLFFYNNKTYFVGYFGEISYSEAGKVLRPKFPFIWDGVSTFIKLPIAQDVFFRGVSSVFVSTNNDIYVGALVDYPMYWKNSVPIKLDNRFGDIYQVLVSGVDVYAAGLINKYNSNSMAHTACYWKNGQLIELEDNAQAYGICISGTDVYVSGTVGSIPSQYKACYWKNGARVNLPD